jgi:hypothetical protein
MTSNNYDDELLEQFETLNIMNDDDDDKDKNLSFYNKNNIIDVD